MRVHLSSPERGGALLFMYAPVSAHFVFIDVVVKRNTERAIYGDKDKT